MKTLAWNRTGRIAEVGDRIWSYLSPASRFEEEGLLTAAALLQWPVEDVARLGELQFLLSREVGAFLDAVGNLLRSLTSSSQREEEWDYERLRGPVMWSRTLSLRAAGGSPNLWVTAPARRDHQTPENQMLVHLLDTIVEVGRRSGWESYPSASEPVSIVRDRIALAEYWQQSRPLAQIERTPLTPRDVMRVRSGRAKLRYATVIGAYDRYEALVGNLDRRAVREAIEQVALITASEGRLFELLSLFNMIDALAANGWNLAPVRLFQGKLCISGHRTDGRRLHLLYQATPAEFRADSIYDETLDKHGVQQRQPLRPDMTLRWEDSSGTTRWLLVECKLSESQGAGHAARQALLDLLAYRRAFDSTLQESLTPYGLGLAWGGGLIANPESEVILCTPDHLTVAIDELVS